MPPFAIRNLLVAAGSLCEIQGDSVYVGGYRGQRIFTYGERIAANDFMDTLRDVWPRLEPEVDVRARYALDQPINEARAKARERIQNRRFGELVSTLLVSDATTRFVSARDVILPAFFEAFPNGSVRIVRYADNFNSFLTSVSILKRAHIVQNRERDVLAAYRGATPLSALNLNVPAEALSYYLSLGHAIFYPKLYGFVTSCQHKFFLVFIFDRPVTLEHDSKPSELRDLVPGFGNIMFARPDMGLILPANHVVAPRRFPLDRVRLSPNDFDNWMADFVDALDDTFRWLMSLDHFHGRDDATRLDLDFAFQTYHTFFALLLPLYTIIESGSAAQRKAALFDALDLLSSFITVAGPQRQAEEWCFLASKDAGESYVSTSLALYPAPINNNFQTALREILDRNLQVISQGFLYSLQDRQRLGLGYNAEQFQPRLLRELRNAKHGFAIRNWRVLDVHSGDFDNDFPDYALLLALAFLKSKTIFSLSRV